MMRLSKIPMPVLVLLSAITLPLSASLYLEIDKKGFAALEFKDLLTAWPNLLLMGAIPILFLSILVALVSPSLSRQLAWVGIGLGWTYYALSFVALCFVASLVMFMTSWTYLFFAPLLFLAAATYRLRQEQKTVMPV